MWEPSDKQRFKDEYFSGCNNSQLAMLFDTSIGKVKHYLLYLRSTGELTHRHSKRVEHTTVCNEHMPVFKDKIQPSMGWRESLDFAVQSAEFHKQHQYWQDEATVDIDTDRPAILVYSGDWHFGSLATDHEHFKQWIEMILETENVYLVSVGPDLETRGHFRSIMPTLEQVFGPEIQQRVFGQIWQELTNNGKLLAGCWDNHSIEQYEKLIGFSPVAQMMAKEIPFFRGIGTLHVNVGEQSYSHFVSHSTRFNSSFNLTHGLKQIARMLGFTGDIVCAGHIHNPAVEMTGEQIFVRTGTFKTDCGYSQRFFGQGKFAAPCIVLHPERHAMLPFWYVDQAQAYIKGLR